MDKLFDFNFNNPFGFLIAFIPGLINLGLLVYILLRLPKSRVTNLFALLTLSMSCWQINDAMGRISNSAYTTDLWDCIFSVAWIMVGALCLHFALAYTKKLSDRFSRCTICLLYVPGFVFMGLYQAHIYDHPFIDTGFWGWVNYHDKHTADLLMVWWISALVLTATGILCYNTLKVRGDKQLWYQSLVITSGIAVPTITGVLTQVIFPVVLGMPSIPVTSTFMTLFSVATVVALRRFNLFSVSDLVSNEKLLESMPMVVISISRTKRINHINSYAVNKLGLSPKELQLPIDEIFRHESAADQLNFEVAWNRPLQGQEMKNIESSFITPKGTIYALISSSPIVNNKEVQGAVITMRDITEIRKTHQMIAASEAQLKLAQKLAKIGSWEWDIKADEIKWSDELYRIFGYAPREMPVDYQTYLSVIHPADRDNVDHVITKAYNDRRAFSFYHRAVRNSDGVEIILHSRGKVTTDQHGKPVRMQGTAQDVTEMKKNEEMLQYKNEELQKINSELDRFVYSVSHDLRSPLTSMLGLVDIAEQEAIDPSIQQYLALIRSSVEKLDKFIQDILDYSQNSRMEVDLDPIHFDGLITEITAPYRSAGNIEIRTAIDNNRAFYSDKTRLTMILNNLVSNAIRYAGPSTSEPFVEISVRFEGKIARIHVKDNGIGIPAAIQPRIFEMFYRGTKESVGSGLGLYIVKEAVDKLKGEIQLESEPGKGTEFIISVPNMR